MNRSRPPVPYASPALLIGALIASIAVHVLVLSGPGWFHWQRSVSLPSGVPLLLQLNTQPSTPPEVPAPRVSEQDHSGSGNTSRPHQRQTSRQATPAATQDSQAVTAARAHPSPPLTRLTRPAPQPRTPRAPHADAAQSAPNAPLSAADLLEQAVQMASLPGENAEQDNNTEPCRAKAVAGLNAQGVEWARYVEDWQLKVERIGTFNFPEEARQQQVYGGPVLTVQINPDGSLHGAPRIVRSSGHTLLDAAAVRIVRQAAPFPPFPPSLASRYRILEITRKWSFTADNRLSGQ
jgi:protein TonB